MINNPLDSVSITDVFVCCSLDVVFSPIEDKKKYIHIFILEMGTGFLGNSNNQDNKPLLAGPEIYK